MFASFHSEGTMVVSRQCCSYNTGGGGNIFDPYHSVRVRPMLTFLFNVHTNVGRIKLRYVNNLNNSYDVT